MDDRKRRFLLVLPFVLLLSAALVFTLLARWLGQAAGYLLGFAFYWLVWCLLVPRWVLGKGGLRSVLADRVPLFSRANWLPALVLVVISAISVWMYLPEWTVAPLRLILLSVPLATFNGFCEEILWRGLYVRVFPDQPLLRILYPAFGFALWHIAPQLVIAAEGGTLIFVAMTFPLGLAYGWIAARTGSARWTALSHSVNGIVALGGALAPSVLALLE